VCSLYFLFESALCGELLGEEIDWCRFVRSNKLQKEKRLICGLKRSVNVLLGRRAKRQVPTSPPKGKKGRILRPFFM
jgi:hypothetical protein